MDEKIIVLDFGSEYALDIVRRVRELNVYCELWSYKTDLNKIKSDHAIKGVILSGSPASVNDVDAPIIDKELFDLGIPVLGICYGMQLMTKLLKGQVVTMTEAEIQEVPLVVHKENSLSQNKKILSIWMAHYDHVERLADGFESLASTEKTPIAMMQHHKKPLYGVQFHPEVSDSRDGKAILDNFLVTICKVKKNYTMKSFIQYQIEKIRAEIKDDHVILGLSGGVDSSVVAALLSKAIGSRLHCIFVDHGLMRKHEKEDVYKAFENHFDLDLIMVDAQDRFLDKLEGVSDPELKRKIIGHEFIEVFDEESKKIKNAKWLAQGTLYTDVIESGTDVSKVIKSHHNVGGLPEKMEFKLVEPLNTLFKDEVRELGLQLGLPDYLVYRQPFPGPGIGVRIVGAITREKVRIVQDSDFILREEIAKANLNKSIWQYFTVLTPIKTVGTIDGNRTYDNVLVIRAVNSSDGMTAEFARIPLDVLDVISQRIIYEVDGVGRVVYDITSKPPGTIEWE